MTALLEASSTSMLPAALAAAVEVDDRPGREIRYGGVVLGAFTLLFVGWTALTPLDAASTATGRISVSGHNQMVQHREGGVVAAVDVTEGQHVRAGQVLIELAPGELGAEVKTMRAEYLSLLAQKARLAAEAAGAPQIEWPAELVNAKGDEQAVAQEAMRNQEHQFLSGISLLRAAQAIDQSRAAGLEQQISGLQSGLRATERQQELLDQQMKGIESLAAKGFASQNSVRALQRSEADLTGTHGQYTANINDYRQQIAASQLDARRLTEQRQQSAGAGLRDTEDQLNTLMPKLQAAQGQLDRGTLRAQADGVVTGLQVFRPGSVVAPGQTLMEIVPSTPRLVVDAKIAASDIAGVHAGQRAEVRITMAGARQTPILTGSLSQVSADSFTDDKTGQSFYSAKVVVPTRELQRVNGADSALRPGVPVQVVIPLRKRTAFEYLFEPLTQGLWQAFRQR